MRVDAISFGSAPKIPANHEEMQNKALLEILKHYQETGKYMPAKIDYFQDGTTKITYLNEGSKSKFGKVLAKFKSFVKRMF